MMKKEELKVGDEIPIFCPVCKKETKCRYDGVQKHWLTKKDTFENYTCLEGKPNRHSFVKRL